MAQTTECLQHRRPVFNPWVGKVPWKRKWQPTPVFFLENSMREKPSRLQSMGWQIVGHD